MKTRILLAAALAALAAGLVGVWTSASQGAAAPPDGGALTAARFELTIDGHSVAVFAELQGISSGIDVVDYVPGGDRDLRLRVPKSWAAPTVTLKRGLTRSMEMSAWHEQVLSGNPLLAARDTTIVMYDVQGDPVARWYLENAWPSKVEIGGLKADGGQVLMETVTMTCESLQRIAV